MKDSELYAHRSDLNDAAMEKAEQRVRNRIDNTLNKIDRDIGMSHMDPGDVQRLRYASQQIREGAPRIYLCIDRLKKEEHDCFRLLMRGLDDLTEGLVEAATRLAATPSGANFFGKLERSKLTDPFRKGREAKRAGRSEVLDQQLGRLIDKGLGGESLRKALLNIFDQHKIEGKLSKPSLSTVNSWARNYRRTGIWRAPKRTRQP